MENQNVIDVFNKISAIYVLVVIISSCVFNPLIFFICVKSKKLRSISTFKLIAVGSVNDFICNIWWNQESFTDTFFSFQSYSRSLFYCRVMSVFVQFCCFQMSSWIIVSISLDRFLSMISKKWSKKWFAGPKPIIYSLVLALVIIAINSNEIFTDGYSYFDNGTEMIICYDNADDDYPWFDTMSRINLYFGKIVPYILMIILNSLIIFKATRFQRAQRVAVATTSAANATGIRRKAEMTRTVFIITVFYILTTLPNTIMAGYFYLSIVVLPIGQILVNSLNAFQSTYLAFNFLILFFSNKLFAQEFKLSFRSENSQVGAASNSSKTKRSAIAATSQRKQTL